MAKISIEEARILIGDSEGKKLSDSEINEIISTIRLFIQAEIDIIRAKEKVKKLERTA